MNLTTFKSVYFFIIAILLAQVASSQKIKPVNGTFLNLVYQDVRNKYMNPIFVEDTAPLFWRTKMKEYHEMGISYVIIMAVANEQKSFYPSKFMDLAYSSEKESPVEAIIHSADQYDMKVFLSCGWAYDQDDDISKPEIRNIQIKIMEELTGLFRNNKSFYGWYLPVEESLSPVLSDKAVQDLNKLADKARALTPHKKILISPYGIWNSDLDNPTFGQQIRKLKVDIIAYQDEVGCVREPFPIKRMKENFRILGQIHEGSGIDFWSNIESFTWQKEDNSRESALIPAAFPRYLSQIVGASQAGAKEVVSFSIYGIMDSPETDMPIGQPIQSARFYEDYIDWKAGRGRWPLLEKTFEGEVSNKAAGKMIKFYTSPSSKHNKGNLTDNLFGSEDTMDSSWLGFENGEMLLETDLGKETDINRIASRFLHYRPGNIVIPQMVDFYLSKDGINFWKAGTTILNPSPNDRHDCWVDIALVDNLKEVARYVKVSARRDGRTWIFCDEIIVE